MKACGSHLTHGEAVVAEILASLFLVLTFWKQINLRLSPELFQAQLVARGIRPIHPIQEWLARPLPSTITMDNGTRNARLEGIRILSPFTPSPSSPCTLPTASG